MTNITIRDATADDIPGISRIEELSFSMPWPRSVLADFIEADDRICIVAEADGAVLGYLCAIHVLDEYHIGSVAADPAWRNSGIGSALVGELVSRARASEGQYMFLEVRESNTAARRLYAAFGFSEVATRRNYYDSPTEDAILMTLIL